MNQAVRTVTYWSSTEGRVRQYGTRRSAKRNITIVSHRRTAAAEVAMLGLIVATLQILDGILTGIGMAQFGLHMEGNLILRALMHQIGYIPALVLVKAVAIGVVAALCVHGYHIRWITMALRGVIALYLTFAVIPWTVILTVSFLA